MGWSIGFDEHWQRDIGYGVPAICDSPKCGTEIDRGLSYVCGGEPYGGDRGCGLYFCDKHRFFHVFRDGTTAMLCARCDHYRRPFKPTADKPEWTKFKMTSWEKWREAQKVAK